MTNSGSWFKNRNAERTFLLLTGIIMAFLFWKMSFVLQRDFAEVDSRMANGTMINLNDAKPGERMKDLLKKGMYFEDPKDISFIATKVAAAKEPGTQIDNVGTLNKVPYFVNADQAYSQGGASFKKRVELSRDLLGFSKEDSTSFKKETTHPLQVGSQTNVGLGTGAISGTIKNHGGQPVQAALLRLRLLVPQDNTDATGDDDNDIIQFKDGVRKVLYRDSTKKLQLLSFNAYARTDASGNFLFSGLPVNQSYDLLPLQPGYEFGPSKGVEKLKGSATFHFVQSPHTMKLFSTQDFNNLKKEKAFIVRTPRRGDLLVWPHRNHLFCFLPVAASYFDHSFTGCRSIVAAGYNDTNRAFLYRIIQSPGPLKRPLPGEEYLYLFLHRDGFYSGVPVYGPEKVYA